jgi:ribosome-binding factor A
MRQFKRVDRVRNQILRDVRTLLEHECASHLDAMVTFTDVEMSDDLRYATIYYSVLGDEESKRKTSTYFNKIKKRVQSQLGDLLRIRQTPVIKFEFDASVERGLRIEKLLNEIRRENDGRTQDDI